MSPPKKKKKIFILDTNVILHDSSCLYQFEQHDIFIPISVLEELDRFKTGNDTINFHARAFLRALDKISGDTLFNGGITIGPKQGKLRIKLEQKMHEDLATNFAEGKPDHHILNAAYYLSKEYPDHTAILVTKDVNLRMKAKSVGLNAEDYTTDHVKDITELYTGYRYEEDVSQSALNRLCKKDYSVPISDLKIKKEFLPNEYVIMRNKEQSALGHVNPDIDTIHLIKKTTACNITPRNAEQLFALHALMNKDIKLLTVSGKAGTGKTLLALAAALESRDTYRQVLISRPIVPLSNKDLGYLPGTASEKVNPYMQPLYDNLAVIQNRELNESKHKKLMKVLEEERLVIAPLAYIRGRSLVDIFFIVDEAQNLTPHEIKTIITRAGENTKMVFTGDIFQIDHPYLDTYSNGMSYLIEKMKGQKLYTHVNLEKGERSELAELASNIL